MSDNSHRYFGLNARSINLLRKNRCERAIALLSAKVDLVTIREDLQTQYPTPHYPGEEAKQYGQHFENALLKNRGKRLLEALNEEYECFFSQDKEDYHVFEKVGEGEGEETPHLRTRQHEVWKRTLPHIFDRWKNNTKSSIVVHGILRIEHGSSYYYIEPDLLLSPPGVPYYIPYEIKSHESNEFIGNSQHINDAVTQSSLYLYALLYGKNEKNEPFPESNERRNPLQTGIIFRKNGTLFPDLMTANAERDFHALENIFQTIPKNDEEYKNRFGHSKKEIQKDYKKFIDHINTTFSDACLLGCPLVERCKSLSREKNELQTWGEEFKKNYYGYTHIEDIEKDIVQYKNTTTLCSHPDIKEHLDVEHEIEHILGNIPCTNE